MVILTLNNQKEIEKFSSKIKNDLEREKIRVKILSEKSLNYRIRETYKKLINFYFLIGNEEIGRKIIKLQKVYEQTEESIEIEFLAKKIKEYIENSRNKE